MRHQKERSIDGLVFTVQMLPATKGYRLFYRLLKALGPTLLRSLCGASSKEVSGGGLKNVKIEDMTSAAILLFDRFSEADLDYTIKELFETATVTENGKTFQLMPVFDNILAGKMLTLYKALTFALEVNYQDFFPALLASAQTVMAAPLSAE